MTTTRPQPSILPVTHLVIAFLLMLVVKGCGLDGEVRGLDKGCGVLFLLPPTIPPSPPSYSNIIRYHQMTVRNFSTAGMEGKGGRKEMTTYTRPSPPFTLGATVRFVSLVRSVLMIGEVVGVEGEVLGGMGERRDYTHPTTSPHQQHPSSTVNSGPLGRNCRSTLLTQLTDRPQDHTIRSIGWVSGGRKG